MQRILLIACILVAAPVLAGCASDAGTKATPTPSVVPPSTPATVTTPTIDPVPATPTPDEGAEPCYTFEITSQRDFAFAEGGDVTATLENCGETPILLQHACTRGIDLAILAFHDDHHDGGDAHGHDAMAVAKARYELSDGGTAGATPMLCAVSPTPTAIEPGESLELSVTWDGMYAPKGCETSDCVVPLPAGGYDFVANALGVDEVSYGAILGFRVLPYEPCVEAMIGTSRNVIPIGAAVEIVASAINCGTRAHTFEDPCLDPVRIFVAPEGGNATPVGAMPCATAPPWTRTLEPSRGTHAVATWDTTNLTAGNWTITASAKNEDGTYLNETTRVQLVAPGTTSAACATMTLMATNATFQRANGTSLAAKLANCGTGAMSFEHPCLRAMDVVAYVAGEPLALGPDGVEPTLACATAPPWARELAANETFTLNATWNGFVVRACIAGETGCVFPADAGRHLAIAWAEGSAGWNAAAYRWLTIEA